MRTLSFAILLCITMAGCVSDASSVPHADGPGSTTSTSGPTLCRDGTAPPCNDR